MSVSIFGSYTPGAHLFSRATHAEDAQNKFFEHLMATSSAYPTCANAESTSSQCAARTKFTSDMQTCVEDMVSDIPAGLRCTCNILQEQKVNEFDKCSDFLCATSESDVETARRVNKEMLSGITQQCKEAYEESKKDSAAGRLSGKGALFLVVFIGALAGLTL